MNRKWKIGLIAGGIALIAAMAVVLCSVLLWHGDGGSSDDGQRTDVQPIRLPESEYTVHCVLTESEIRYAEDGESYAIDTFAMDTNEELSLVIDPSGIIPLEGRIYRVYVSKKDPSRAVFAAPVTSGGAAKTDLTRIPVASRNAEWLYAGSKATKYHINDSTVFYYLQIMDGYLRRVDRSTVDTLARYTNLCPDHENHVHVNNCFYYNAYVKFSGGFLKPYELKWAAFSVNGASIYYYMGSEKDTETAILPGQRSTRADLAVTTSDLQTDGTIGVQDLNGKRYTCRVNADGVQPVGGRFYRIDAQADGSVRFSVPVRTGANYDYYPAPVTALDEDSVTFTVTATKKLTEKTQRLRASISWTGWMTLESIDVDVITMANTTAECQKKGAHEHTKSCYYYNAYYKADGHNGVDWVLTESTGTSVYSAVGGEQDVPWGSCDPANTAVITAVDGDRVTFTDMHGDEHTCRFTADEGLAVYAGGLYHVEYTGGTAVISKVNTTVTKPGFDATRQPLRAIEGNKLTFSQGSGEKITYLTDSTKIFYMGAGDNRLIPMPAAKLQTAQRTGDCLEKGEHEHTNGCFYSNTIFACDGQGNLKWIICSAKNGSIYSTLGDSKNLVKPYADAAQTCLTLSGVDADGRVELLQMNGERTAYAVHPDGLTPLRGRIYACQLRDGKMVFSAPNANGAKHFTRSGIAEIDDGFVTNSRHETFRVTAETRIFNVSAKNGKLLLGDGSRLAAAVPTNYCKGLAQGHSHNWSKCYSGNSIYATDGAGTLLWILVRTDGNAVSDYIGAPKTTPIQSASAASVLFTTTAISLQNNTRSIQGIDMTGAAVKGVLTEDSLLPVKGSFYHMEWVDGKLRLSVPNTKFRETGYDFGCRPLYRYADNAVKLVTGETYDVTPQTKIYNVKTVGGVLVLADTTELPEAKLTCKKTHQHVNDCYRYNMYFAADGNGDLTWIVTAAADTSLFYKNGLSALESVESGDPAGVAVTKSYAYPVWKDGVRTNCVDIVDMTGAESTVTIDESGLMPAMGKGYHIERGTDGTVRFSKPTTYDVPAAGNAGYDFSRYQVMETDGTYIVLRNSKVLRITADTRIFHASTADRTITLQPGGTVIPSQMTESCTGAEHHHGTGCFPYSVWYACDGNGNLKWIVCEETGTKSIYGAQGSEADVDLAKPDFAAAPVVFVTKGPYLDRNGQYAVDLEDLFGQTYSGMRLDEEAAGAVTAGLPYKAALTGETVSLEKLTSSMVSRDKSIAYADGKLTGDSKRWYKITANTLIRYVKKNSDNTLTLLAPDDPSIPATGFPADPKGYNLIQSVDMGKTTSGGYVQWMLVEATGAPLYGLFDWYGTGVKNTRSPAQIVLVTSDVRWDAVAQQYLVDAVDMTGTERTLVYAEDTDGVVPTNGKMYRIILSDGKATFIWPNFGDVNKMVDGTFYDLIRAPLSDYNAQTGTLYFQKDKKKVFQFADNAVKLALSRKNNSSELAVYEGAAQAPTPSSKDAWNSFFGLDTDGRVVWIANCSTGASVYYLVVQGKTAAPALPPKTGLTARAGDTAFGLQNRMSVIAIGLLACKPRKRTKEEWDDGTIGSG